MKIQKIPDNYNTAQHSEEGKLIHDRNKNIYKAGKVNIEALKTILRSPHNCLIPVVRAAAQDEPPKRPPPMKYKDLPIYSCPHLSWKEYENDKTKCPDKKLMHDYFLPTVSEYRKQAVSIIQNFKTEIEDTVQEIRRDFRSAEKQLLEKARNPKNKDKALAVVAVSGIAGLKYGKTIPRRIFYSSILLFVTGSVCFPKETDEATRTVLYMLGKAFVPLYNFYFGTDWVARDRVPCQRDLPEIPPPTKLSPICEPKTNQQPQTKKK